MVSFMYHLGVPSSVTHIGNSMQIKLSLEMCLADVIKSHSRSLVKEIILDNLGECDPTS